MSLTFRLVSQLDVDAAYFLPKIEEVTHPEYVPTEQDILRTRVRTTGKCFFR